MEAASEGDLQTLRHLVNTGISLEIASQRAGEEELRVLHLASWGGHAELVKIILDHQVDREAVAQGRRAVHWAAVGGHVQVLQVLKERGCQLAALTADGSTSLHLAADYGNLDAVKWLVEQGLNPGMRDSRGYTAKELARAGGHNDIRRYLMTAHVQRINQRCVGSENTDCTSASSANLPFLQTSTQVLEAATEGDLTSLTALLVTGVVDLEVVSNRAGEEGLRPLHLAAWGGHADMVRQILQQGVDLEATAQGRRAVHWAAVGGHVQVLQVLKERGCQLAALTADGSTALHLAADYGNLYAVKWLVEQGVNPDAKDSTGYTAQELARHANYNGITSFLRAKESLIQYEDFTTIKWLGEGSFAKVYLISKHNKLQVLKVINLGQLAGSLRFVAEQELQLLKTIHHPNIVTYLGGEVRGNDLFIVLEYCAGGDLAKLIYQRVQQGGPRFSEKRIVSWALSIASALNLLHTKGILHRDLKPHNIFLTLGNKSVKLGDFGLARVTEGDINMPRTIVGSPAYMSPEVANGLPYDGKADMWSLGCCLYELATLQRGYPYEQEWQNTTLLEKQVRFYMTQPRIHVIDRDINFRMTFLWDPYLKVLLQEMTTWERRPQDTPTLVIFGSALHWMVKTHEIYISKGAEAAAAKYREQLKSLRPHLTRLANTTTVVFKLQDHLQRAIINNSKEAVRTHSNYVLYNEIAVQELAGTGVVVWDSTVPLSDGYARECIRSPNKQTPPYFHWKCQDLGHVGFILVDQYADMVINDFCYKHLNH
ncbi:uncharacterized protein [Cherax quadricarinatus]